MSVSLRNRRVTLYAYSNTGADGLVAHTYTPVPSAAPDAGWWASRGVPTGSMLLMAQQSEHVADSVWTLDAAAPVTPNGLLIDQLTGTAYKVTAVLPRDLSRALIQVLAVTNTDAVYTEVSA